MARTFGVIVHRGRRFRWCWASRSASSIHALPRVRAALDPFFATYYAVPIFIFYPVMIAIFGLSIIPIVLMGVATAIVAMIIATLNGLDRVPRVLTKVARVHRMGALATALRLKLPAAAPHLFTGVKLAVSYGFIAVIASEFLLSAAGLGRDIADAYSDFNNPQHVRADAAADRSWRPWSTACCMRSTSAGRERRGIGKP